MNDNDRFNRRNILHIVGAGTIGGLAGCGSSGNGSSGNGSSGNGSNGNGSNVPQQIKTKYRRDWGDARMQNGMGYTMTAKPGKTIEEVPIEYSSEDSSWAKNWALTAQRGLTQLNFQTRIVDSTVQKLLEGWTTKGSGFPFSYLTHGPDPQRGIDPDPLLGRRKCGLTQNYMNYCYPKVTKLLKTEQTAVDNKERQKALDKLQTVLANDFHQSVPLFPDILTAVNTDTWSDHVVMPGNGAALDSFPWSSVNVQPKTKKTTYTKGGGQPMNHTNIAWGIGGAGEKRLRYLWDGLYDVSPDLKPIPALATSAEFTDKTTVKVKLRDGVKWHDGKPFTPQDVKFSTEMFIKHKSPQMSVYYRDLNSDNPVKILSEGSGGTVQFNLANPSAIFNTVSMVRSVIFPKHIWSKVDDPSKFEPSGDQIVGTGPWQFSQWEQGSRLELTRYDDNWMWNESFRKKHLGDQFASGPGAKKLVWVNTGNIDSTIGAIQKGSLDAINQRLTSGQLKQATGSTSVEEKISKNYAPLHGMTDFTIPLIRDKEFRRAYIGNAFDTDGFIKNVLGGHGSKAQGNNPVFSGSRYFNKNTPKYKYNPGLANQILDQAGYGTDKNGNRTYPKGDAWTAFVKRVENAHKTRDELGQPDFS